LARTLHLSRRTLPYLTLPYLWAELSLSDETIMMGPVRISDKCREPAESQTLSSPISSGVWHLDATLSQTSILHSVADPRGADLRARP